jgi:hypothetical protein
MFHACHRRHGGVKVSINESVFTQPRAGANADCPFCRRSEAMAGQVSLWMI